jgi:hypothetical protein
VSDQRTDVDDVAGDEQPDPVFPFTDEQVATVAAAMREIAEDEDFDGTYDNVARTALTALTGTLHAEHEHDPDGAPRGYGWRSVRFVTEPVTIDPAGKVVRR